LTCCCVIFESISIASSGGKTLLECIFRLFVTYSNITRILILAGYLNHAKKKASQKRIKHTENHCCVIHACDPGFGFTIRKCHPQCCNDCDRQALRKNGEPISDGVVQCYRLNTYEFAKMERLRCAYQGWGSNTTRIEAKKWRLLRMTRGPGVKIPSPQTIHIGWVHVLVVKPTGERKRSIA
jgi:hypothetical protein